MADTTRESDLTTAAAHWSKAAATGRTRWWTSPAIHRHINAIVCGEPLDGAWAGLNERIRRIAPKGGFERGISLGVGHGAKEIELLRLGIVQHFDLFEISETRVEQGIERAAAAGVADRVNFVVADAFAQDLAVDYDLVYWNNAIHHMLDVPFAVRWSRERLHPNGWFVMDDFVGASRFQWPDYELSMATQARQALPERFLRNVKDPEHPLRTTVVRPNKRRLIAQDPTEAADSDRILPSVREVFPGATIIPTGGVIYHSGLNDVLANFDEDDENDLALLNTVLLLDKALADAGSTHYAVAFAKKKVHRSLARRVAGRARRTLHNRRKESSESGGHPK